MSNEHSLGAVGRDEAVNARRKTGHLFAADIPDPDGLLRPADPLGEDEVAGNGLVVASAHATRQNEGDAQQGRPPDHSSDATGSSSSTRTPSASRESSGGSKRPAPSSLTAAAPAATARRSASSAGRSSYRAAMNPARRTSPEPTGDTGAIRGIAAYDRVSSRS